MMHYENGTRIRVGDLVKLEDGRSAEIAAVLDCGEFSSACPKKDWAMLTTGVLVKLDGGGIEHIAEARPNLQYLERPKQKGKLGQWWERPIRPGDRLMSGLLGIWAGLWIGGVGRVLYAAPVGFKEVGVFALGGAVVMFIFGIAFPKVSRFITVPFTFFGVGGGSN